MNYESDIYILAEIKRYSTCFTIRQESVAEHGFFVAALVMELNDKYNFNLTNGLMMAIAHDMPEIELNDASHVLKKNYPEIKEAFDVCERRVAKTLPTNCRLGVQMYDANDSIAATVVHLADAIQCRQFAKVEVSLGNQGYMLKVLRSSEERIKILEQQLERYMK